MTDAMPEYFERLDGAIRESFGEPHYAALVDAAMDQVKADPLRNLPLMLLLVTVVDFLKYQGDVFFDPLERLQFNHAVEALNAKDRKTADMAYDAAMAALAERARAAAHGESNVQS